MIELNIHCNNILNCKLANSRHILLPVKAYFTYFIKPCPALFTLGGLGRTSTGWGGLIWVGGDLFYTCDLVTAADHVNL